jgi:peptide/nickel transport system permease protein
MPAPDGGTAEIATPVLTDLEGSSQVDADTPYVRRHLGDRFRDTAASLLRSPVFCVGASIVLGWILVAILWRWIAPYNPYAIHPYDTFASPSSSHWLGTDELGRDVFSRVLAGSTTVLTIAPASTLLAVLMGTVLGLAAGYFKGILDDVLMRTVDGLLAFPPLIVAIIVLSALGRSELNVILLIAVFFSPLIARVVRSAVLAERERDYINAARMRGEGVLHIMYVEILPNVTGPIFVEATIRLGYAVFTAATLSFLGFGLAPPSADWGLTVASERGYIENAPWTVLGPAIALASLVIGVSLVADGARRAVNS